MAEGTADTYILLLIPTQQISLLCIVQLFPFHSIPARDLELLLHVCIKLHALQKLLRLQSLNIGCQILGIL